MEKENIEIYEQIAKDATHIKKCHSIIRWFQIIADITGVMAFFILWARAGSSAIILLICLFLFNICALIERRVLSTKLSTKRKEALEFLAAKHQTSIEQINYHLPIILKGHRDFSKSWWLSKEKIEVIDQELQNKLL